MQVKLDHDIREIERWFENTRLVINAKKSNTMFISTALKDKHLVKSTTEVILPDSLLECVNNQKVLGIKLDNHLTFVPHINFIFSKMSILSGLLWRIRDCIPETTNPFLQFLFLASDGLLFKCMGSLH